MCSATFDLVNGAKIPTIGFGTWTISDETQLELALESALETGYRHIDTAAGYQNEHLIGNILKRWFISGKLKRENVFITTKLSRDGVHPDKVEEHIKKSLEKLQLDYLDLYIIHFPMYVPPGKGVDPLPTDLVGTWKKLEEQVDLGRTKAIGLSNFNKDQVGRILANSRIKPATNQVELHVYLQQPELVKFCQENDIVVVSYSSLGNPGQIEFDIKQGRPPRIDILKDPVVIKIAEKHQKSAAQILLKFLLQKNIAVIPKSITPSRIKDNLDLYTFTLDVSDMSTLQALDQGENGRRVKWDSSKPHISHPEYPFKIVQ